MKTQTMIKNSFFKWTLFLTLGLLTYTNGTFAQSSTATKEESTQIELKKKMADIVWNDKLEDLKAMVEKDKSLVNFRLDNEETPMTAAAYKGYINMVKYLLSMGADINSVNKWNNSALLNTAQTGNVELGKLLIEKGANLEARGPYNYTPLLCALDGNKPEFAIMTINNGANIHAKDNENRPAIEYASWYANPNVIKALVEKGNDVNYVSSGKYSILHNVCSNGNVESIDFLIQKGANVNLANADGDLPLQMVTINCNSEAVKLLAKKTKNINQKEKYLGNTALHQAAINGDIKSTQYLLEAGADPNITNNQGLKPVDYAAKYGYVKLVGYYGSLRPEYNLTNNAKLAVASANEKFSSNELKVYYTGHSGWALQFKDKVIIIDYWKAGIQNAEPSLVNGTVNPDELKGKKVYVFATHNHSDHYDTTIFQWKKSVKDIKYVYGFRPEKTSDNKDQPYHGPSYTYINDNQTGVVDDIKVTTIKSNDTGQGFLLEVNGLKIFHPGDHALFNADLEADFKKEIDFVARQTGNIDIAFLPVTGCPSSWKKENIVQGFFYIIDKMNPAEVFPMHAYQREHALKEFAELAKQRNCASKLFCIENRGDHDTYNKMVTATAGK
jgi:ankyrin repeat protein/L-ascorbate metabolism protein UlaG (beta-lactamase superfamily)